MRDIGLRREQYTAAWPQEEFIVPLVSKTIERLLNEFSSQIKGKKVIDIGSGSQPFKKQIESLGGVYFSLEIEQHFFSSTDFTGAIDDQLNSNILEAGPYDFILCTEVLEHVAAWNIAFKNFHALLKPGGVIVTSAPFFYQLHEIPYDYWRPTPYAFGHFARENALNVVRVEKAGNFWDVAGTLLGNRGAVIPKKKNIVHKITGRIISYCMLFVFKLLKSRFLHNNFENDSPLYQSTVVIMSKD